MQDFYLFFLTPEIIFALETVSLIFVTIWFPFGLNLVW